MTFAGADDGPPGDGTLGGGIPGGDVLRQFVAAVAGGLVVVDESGVVLLGNTTAAMLFGRADLVGEELGFPLAPNEVTEVEVLFEPGTTRPVELRVTEASWGSDRAYVVAVRDLSQVAAIAEQLHGSEERFRSVFDEAPLGLVILDERLRVIRANEALRRMLGYDPDELEALALADVVPSAGGLHGRELHRQVLAGELPRGVEGDAVAKGGALIPARTTVTLLRHDASSPARAIAIIEDISEPLAAQRRLEHVASHDLLTGLGNRRVVTDALEQALERAAVTGAYVALLYLDLDHFKVVNDTYGHEAGDAVLVASARRLESVLRATDTPGRLGGDEFVVVCDELSATEASARRAVKALAGRIARVMGNAVDVPGGRVTVSASMGIALVRGIDQPADVVLRHADAAMYQAKQQGRARWVIFDEALRRRAATRIDLTSELAVGIDRHELVVHYQPIVDLDDGRIVAAEALVRWNHPERGLLMPVDFLDVAEAEQLVRPLGAAVLLDACRALADWRAVAHRDLAVSVNVSARQLGSGAFGALVTAALDETGVPPSALYVELTERALVDASGPSLIELDSLRDSGVHLGLDDFGTGYASLTALHRLPVDFLKLDGSFIAGIAASPQAAAIVRAVVDLGRALELDVIAEGVETEEQAQALRALACHTAQGWHTGRPVTAEAFAALVAAP